MSDTQDPLAPLREQIPRLREWISRTLAVHAAAARPTLSAGFQRLPLSFPGPMGANLLESARFVVVDRVPKPPLASWGLEEFKGFEEMPSDAITYGNTYFITPAAATDEATHVHELVHVVQWQVLGFENFVLSYAVGLRTCGYYDNPLESMAYFLQLRFTAGQDNNVGAIAYSQIGFMYGRKT